MKRFVGIALGLMMLLGCGFSSQDEHEGQLGVATLCGSGGGAGGAMGSSSTAATSTTAASSSSTTAASSSSSSSSTGGGVIPGGESTAPAPACTWPSPTARVPTVVQYGTAAAQSCDVYSPPSPTGDVDLMIVSSGFTGGTRAAAQWVLFARHRADLGHRVYVCDVRHAAAGGVNPFPAPPNDARCALRTAGAASPTGHVRILGASAGGNLALYTAALAGVTAASYSSQSVTFDADGTCLLPWAASDAAIVSKVITWADPADLRVKIKIQAYPPPPAVPQPNMDAYLNLPSGEADPLYVPKAGLASPIFFLAPGMAQLLAVHAAGDFVVYPEHDAGSGAAGLTCTSVHPTGLVGAVAATRAAGVNATLILTPCPSTQHLPTFNPPTIGDCTADLF